MLVTVEGGEGSGKSSVVLNLHTKMLENEIKHICINDPSRDGVELSSIRKLLLSKRFDLSNNAELLLYAASRAQLVDKKIKPALAKNKIVLCDRFYDSTHVYQGHIKGQSFEAIKFLNKYCCGDVQPDLTFLCDVDPKTGLARSKGYDIDESRWEEMGLEIHTKVNQAYRQLAHKEWSRFVILDSNRFSIEEMTDFAFKYILVMREKIGFNY